MGDFLLDWLNMLIRWGHIVVGIAWIGTSFYFVGLDYSLRKKAEHSDELMGDSWLVHGGGFYHVQKYKVAPSNLPEHLIWYKWDAYLTWITGFALLVVQYYVYADTYLVDPAKADMTGTVAVLISLASLAGGWVVYDAVCKLTQDRGQLVTAILVFALICFAAWGFSQIYSGRGALIHVGAFVGTIMAANVFGVIIPNQKLIVAALLADKAPDAKLGVIGKQRSLHNNYLTLPVLLMMVSNHYPLLYSHPQTWIVVAMIIVVGACIRHMINRHEAGDEFRQFAWALPSAAVALLVALVLTTPRALLPTSSAAAELPPVTNTAAFTIVKTHCASCHAPLPGLEEFFAAPQGVRLASIDDMIRNRRGIYAQSVISQAMPMGNASGMTPDERTALGAWVAQQDRNQ